MTWRIAVTGGTTIVSIAIDVADGVAAGRSITASFAYSR